MDIFTHAVAGAATGAAFGRPLLGAVVAVLPDSALWLRPRLAKPPGLYRAAHSGLGLLTVWLAALPFGIDVAAVVLWAWASHILLDIPTHGPEWSPRLFWPDELSFTCFKEWEWFNSSWWWGLLIAVLWSCLWFL